MVAEVILMREEENKRMTKPSKVQKLFRKRWVFPAVYLFSAAIIITAVLWFQGNAADQDKQKAGNAPQHGQHDSVEVSNAVEKLVMPVVKENSVEVKTPFYSSTASEKEQQAALVFYNNTYHQNTGIDVVAKDGKTFDVTAAASGTVTKAVKDPILGYTVEIDHQNGLVTFYQSLSDVKVQAGDTVKQGQVIAKAGESTYNAEAKTHLHFEVRKDGVAVNPTDSFSKQLATIKAEVVSETTPEGGNSNTTEQGTGEGTKSTDEQSKKQPSTDTESKDQTNTTDDGSSSDEDQSTGQ